MEQAVLEPADVADLTILAGTLADIMMQARRRPAGHRSSTNGPKATSSGPSTASRAAQRDRRPGLTIRRG